MACHHRSRLSAVSRLTIDMPRWANRRRCAMDVLKLFVAVRTGGGRDELKIEAQPVVEVLEDAGDGPGAALDAADGQFCGDLRGGARVRRMPVTGSPAMCSVNGGDRLRLFFRDWTPAAGRSRGSAHVPGCAISLRSTGLRYFVAEQEVAVQLEYRVRRTPVPPHVSQRTARLLKAPPRLVSIPGQRSSSQATGSGSQPQAVFRLGAVGVDRYGGPCSGVVMTGEGAIDGDTRRGRPTRPDNRNCRVPDAADRCIRHSDW